MNALVAILDAIAAGLAWLPRATLQAGVLVILVAMVHWGLGRFISAKWRCAMWLLVAVRLVLPVTPRSPVSVYNLYRPEPTKKVEQVDALRVGAEPRSGIAPSAVRGNAGASEVVTTPAVEFSNQRTITNNPPLPPARRLTWKHAAVALWLAGVVVVVIRFVAAMLRLRKMARGFVRVSDGRILRPLGRAMREMGIARSVPVYLAEGIGSPALLGAIRPKLLLPAGMGGEFSEEELRLVFLHELAHLRRRDVLINYLLFAVAALHWFNPLVHFAFWRFRQERELACDELVLRAAAGQQRVYGLTLLKLLQTVSGGNVLPGAVGILENSHPVRRRIAMIATFENRRRWTTLALAAGIGLAAVAMTEAVAPADSEPARPALQGEKERGPAQPLEGSTEAVKKGSATESPKDPAGLAGKPGNSKGANEAANPAGQPDSAVNRPRRPALAAPKSVEAARLEELLSKRLPDVKFDSVALSDVIEFLRDSSGVNIVANWREIEGAGITKDAPVTLLLKDVTVSDVFRLTLKQVSPELLLNTENGIVLIETGAPKARAAVIRAYDISDLLGEAGKDPALREKKAAELVSLIETTMQPLGVDMLAVKAFNNKVIVTADEATQKEIAKVLEMLREKPTGGRNVGLGERE